VWSYVSVDANLPVSLVLGGQVDFDCDKFGDTDGVLTCLFVCLFCVCVP